MLRKFKIVLWLLLFVSLQCAAALPCKRGDLKSFEIAWKVFSEKSVSGTPVGNADLYSYPLSITEGTESGEEFQISHESFIKNYDLIFRRQLKGIDEGSSLIDQLKGAPEFTNKGQFDANGCSYLGTIGWMGYYFKWSENGQWLVNSVERAELKKLKKIMK